MLSWRVCCLTRQAHYDGSTKLSPASAGLFLSGRWQPIASHPRCCGGLLITFAEKSQPLLGPERGKPPPSPRSARLASRPWLCARPALPSEAPTLLRRGSASPNYITSVMSRRPPAATKPMPTSSPSVIAIAMPPTKANTPTTAASGPSQLKRFQKKPRQFATGLSRSPGFAGETANPRAQHRADPLVSMSEPRRINRVRGSQKKPRQRGAGLSLWVSRMGLAGSPGGKECGSKPTT